MRSCESKRVIHLACQGDSTVLLTGPTGTGKSTLAREIHERSARRNKPFIVINLATLHEGTLESELFGRERGAYTGADFKRVGKIELDEIAELPLHLQARLLEFMQSRTIAPMGSNRQVKLDVRIIAATHQPLAKRVREGKFREDLFHRLRVLEVNCPGLASLSDQFGEIVHSILTELSSELSKEIHRIHPEVANRLEAYPWPGNYRELRNVLEFAIQSCSGSEILLQDLPAWFVESKSVPLDAPLLGVAEFRMGSNYYAFKAEAERTYLLTALTQFGGSLSLTARKVGMNKTTLIRKVRELGIHPSGTSAKRGLGVVEIAA
jgi:DNA-binding NtrC family response regulator